MSELHFIQSYSLEPGDPYELLVGTLVIRMVDYYNQLRDVS